MRRLRYPALPLLALATVAQAQTVGQVARREATPPATAATTITATDGSGQRLSAPVSAVTNPDGSAIGSGTSGGVADSFVSGTLALGTANAVQSVPVSITAGQNAVTFTVVGLSGSGATVVVEGNSGGTVSPTWAAMYVLSASTGAFTSTFTVDGSHTLNVAGRTDIRLRVQTAASSASNATVTFNRSVAVRDVGIDKPLPPGSNALGFTGTNALVVTGDQSYALGTQQQLTMAPSGGLKVGVSYNSNITPAAPVISQLNSALVAGKYFATRPTWSDGYTGALQVDSGGNLFVNGASDNLTQVGGAALTLGQKPMAASVPVTLASDGSYATAANQTNGSQQVQGNVASGTADSGNPVKIGGRYNVTLPVFTDGQRGDFQISSGGRLYVSLSSTSGSNIARLAVPNQDGEGSYAALYTTAYPMLVNPTASNSYSQARGDANGAYIVSKGGSNLATGQVSVGTTATLIAAARPNRQKITYAVTTAVQCSYGNSGVTLTTGFPLQAVAGASQTLDTNAAIYGVCASTATVGYMEQY